MKAKSTTIFNKDLLEQFRRERFTNSAELYAAIQKGFSMKFNANKQHVKMISITPKPTK